MLLFAFGIWACSGGVLPVPLLAEVGLSLGPVGLAPGSVGLPWHHSGQGCGSFHGQVGPRGGGSVVTTAKGAHGHLQVLSGEVTEQRQPCAEASVRNAGRPLSCYWFGFRLWRQGGYRLSVKQVTCGFWFLSFSVHVKVMFTPHCSPLSSIALCLKNTVHPSLNRYFIAKKC